jgi:hypothetical protein
MAGSSARLLVVVLTTTTTTVVAIIIIIIMILNPLRGRAWLGIVHQRRHSRTLRPA